MTTDTTTQRAIQQNLPSIYHRVSALLDSSFRWNDDGVTDTSRRLYGDFIFLSAFQLLHHSCLLRTNSNDNGSDYEYFVIPAQAGIQWFRQSMPAPAGMTI